MSNRCTCKSPVCPAVSTGRRFSQQKCCKMQESPVRRAAPQHPLVDANDSNGPEAIFASLWPNGSKVRTADLYAKRSEGPVSALSAKMCMPQHQSVWVLCLSSLRLTLMSPPAQFPLPPPKNTCGHPPPNLPHWKAGRGMFCWVSPAPLLTTHYARRS